MCAKDNGGWSFALSYLFVYNRSVQWASSLASLHSSSRSLGIIVLLQNPAILKKFLSRYIYNTKTTAFSLSKMPQQSYLYSLILKSVFIRLSVKYPRKMKNKFLLAVLLFAVVATITSCYSSRKSGCPTNVNSNAKFRG